MKNNLLAALCRANQGILQQKLLLLNALASKHGPDTARALFQAPCPMVKASIGQHLRHSMDHMEAAVLSSSSLENNLEIHYDLRKRGGSDEHDWQASQQRIQRVSDLLEELSSRVVSSTTDAGSAWNQSVTACFMLSGDSEEEYPLVSSVARELGFAAHHSIHHMAMVRIIAVHTGGLSEEDLPSDFGRAPSTVTFDHSV
jgi:hypothetical protein